jgi:hypothetical protein
MLQELADQYGPTRMIGPLAAGLVLNKKNTLMALKQGGLSGSETSFF